MIEITVKSIINLKIMFVLLNMIDLLQPSESQVNMHPSISSSSNLNFPH